MLPSMLAMVVGVAALFTISVAIRARKAGDAAKEKTWQTASIVMVALCAALVIWSSSSH